MTFTIEHITKKNQQIVVEISIENKEDTFDVKIPVNDYHGWLEKTEGLNYQWSEFDHEQKETVITGRLSFAQYWQPIYIDCQKADLMDYIIERHAGEIQRQIDEVNNQMINDYKND